MKNILKLLILNVFVCFTLTDLAADTFKDTEKVETSENHLPPYENNGKYWPQDTRFLVIVHQYDGDISWAARLKFPHIIYNKNSPEKEPFNAINKAKAETNLLKFISQFYDDLPENLIQVYQYEYKGHHEGSLVDILNAPNFEMKYAQSKTQGFWNFNILNMGDTAISRMIESGWWNGAMAPWFGDIQDYGDFPRGKRSCAQFVVSRERIKSLPREFYTNMYWWLVNNTVGEVTTGYHPTLKTRYITPEDNHSNSNYFTSRYMEYSWELIFTSHKPHEFIGVPFFLEKNPPEQISQKDVGIISALYGAKKYYRDVTSHVVYHFLRNGKIVIPAAADFNDLLGDTVVNAGKTLILNVNGKDYRIPEVRLVDTIIDLRRKG
ncbi:MAG: DUF3431 domain-containing protein [Chlamydiales bacterium]